VKATGERGPADRVERDILERNEHKLIAEFVDVKANAPTAASLN
jgi:hypothetical protein